MVYDAHLICSGAHQIRDAPCRFYPVLARIAERCGELSASEWHLRGSGYPPLRVACSGPRLFSRCSFAAHSSQTFCPHHSLLGIHRIRSAPPFRHGRHLDGVCRVCPFNRLAIIGELLLYIDSILCGICALHHLGGLLALAHRLADHRGCELWRGRAPRGCTACRPRSFCCARSCS
jgi:hypothetical protein